MKNFLIAILFALTMSCAPLTFIGAPTLPLKERFMQLAFWGTGRTLYPLPRNTGILHKERARISVFGDSAAKYREEIDEAIDFFRPYFDLEVTYGYDKSADILLDVHGSSAPDFYHMIVDRTNRRNRILYDIYGMHRTYDPSVNWLGFQDAREYTPYEYKNMVHALIVGLPAPCLAIPYYRDIDEQRKLGWSDFSFKPLGEVDIELFDFHIVHVFTGTSGDDGKRAKANRFEPVIPFCLVEELGHALTGWIDVPDPNRVYFSNAYDSGGDYKKFAAKARSELGELRQMLEVYNDPALEPMMGYDEVEKIARRHFQD